jgi:hypothetical protein
VETFSTNTPLRDSESSGIIENENIQFGNASGQSAEYQKLPEDSNTWVYWDNKVTHGTDWYTGHSKILIMYFGKTKQLDSELILEKSQSRYSKYVIYDESLPS